MPDEFEGGKRKKRSTRSATRTATRRHKLEGGKRKVRRHRHVGGDVAIDGGARRRLRSAITQANSALARSLKVLSVASKRRGVKSAARKTGKRKTKTAKRRTVRR